MKNVICEFGVPHMYYMHGERQRATPQGYQQGRPGEGLAYQEKKAGYDGEELILKEELK
jgi:hypothetical protein